METKNPMQDTDLRGIIREAIHEFVQTEQTKAEPAYKAELLEERRRREQLEQKINVLVEENRKGQQMAEELQRQAAIRTELQRLGVAKVDLAFKAIKDDVFREADGQFVARSGTGPQPLQTYVTQFVQENPELLPPRIPGGSGASNHAKASSGGSMDLERIKPGMSAEELERARHEISRVALDAMRGR